MENTRLAAMLPSQPPEHISNVQAAPSRAADVGHEAQSHGPALCPAQMEDGRHVPSPGIHSNDIRSSHATESTVVKSENHGEKAEFSSATSSHQTEGLVQKNGFWGCWLCIPRCGRCWSAPTDTRLSYFFNFCDSYLMLIQKRPCLRCPTGISSLQTTPRAVQSPRRPGS
jgi:hypothetical protein